MNEYAGVPTIKECKGLIRVYQRGLTKAYTKDKQNAIEAKIAALRERIGEIEREQEERQVRLF